MRRLERSNESLAAPAPLTVNAGMRRRAVVAAALMLAIFGATAAGIYLSVRTPNGLLIVDSNDPAKEWRVMQDGVVVIDRTTNRELTIKLGKYNLEVFDKTGGETMETKSFTLKRGEYSTTIRIPPPVPPRPVSSPKTGAPEPVIAADPDRQAAEWVLANGGWVKVVVDGKVRQVRAVADLPTNTFGLTQVNLMRRRQMAGLQKLEGLTDLRLIDLSVVDEAELADLKGLPNIFGLTLHGPLVTDAGLIYLKALPSLTDVDLSETRATEKGLDYLKALPSLRNRA